METNIVVSRGISVQHHVFRDEPLVIIFDKRRLRFTYLSIFRRIVRRFPFIKNSLRGLGVWFVDKISED